MKFSPAEESVLKAIEEFEIVDAHEHIYPEKIRLEQKVDVFTLFSHYTRVDLVASGMPPEQCSLFLDSFAYSPKAAILNPAIPLEKRWEMFAPYLKNIRYGSYARPAFIAAKEVYGFDDINDNTYKVLSERIAAENTSGIYNRILREKCKIRVALTQTNSTDYDFNLLVPLMPLGTYSSVRSKKTIEEYAVNFGENVKTLDDYIEVIRKGLERWKSQGVVGIKMGSGRYDAPDRSQAVALFDRLMRNEEKELPPMNPLFFFLMEATIDIAAELGLVVAVHTGMWGDFRDTDPQLMIPILSRHPKTRFDIYHLGIPYVREAILLGKNFPNVWLNLCWCHVISPRIVCSAIDELIDMVPINKIIAFGGDYTIPVEKVYGHLVMARENVAKVLGRRVEEDLMTENEAVEIAKRWFYDNPKELYQLKI